MCVRQHQPQNTSHLSSKYGHRFKQYRPVTSSLPEDMDWRTSGAVSSVKDQVRNTASSLINVILRPYCVKYVHGCRLELFSLLC